MGYSSQSAMLKREIEAKLSSRIPAALSPQALQAPRLMSSGVLAIDGLLGGGLPIGGVTEFTGLASSGRTSLAFSLLRGATADSACAYIDVDDTFDPKCAAASGVNHQNLLWVRVASLRPRAEVEPSSPAPTSRIGQAEAGKMVGGHCGSNHPRTETKGLDAALGQMLMQKAETRLQKMEGTPGYPNGKLSLAAAPEEQVAYEHFNARHADESDPIRQADRRAATEARDRAQAPVLVTSAGKKIEKPWSRLDKAIRATDQILQSGGFRVVVLDLASVPPEQALRIPSATWFRFRRAAQESDAIFLLLTQVACARSSALCVLDCSAGAPMLSGNLLNGLSRTAEVARQRLSSPFAKKAPGRAVSWQAAPAWMRAAGQ
ncbi:RecA domain protein (plasmid) [Granulicella tundricola MP5ACTX9]|uniref:Protein RecA n=2 Tax=Granulicella TaxID=940557 RepID=E8X7B2_GRATM|nr:RecA domain protein [Granulicella tundricola MP5ACTX9]